MSCFLAFVSLIVLFSCGLCMEFDDTTEDELSEIKNKFNVNVAVLKQKIIDESIELQEWLMRVAELERHIHDMKKDKLEVLSRRKRGVLKDPRLRMFVGKPGHPGRPGTPGIPGAIGRRGEKGHKGIAGSPGLRGPRGPYGPPGWQGPPGFMGAEGIKGEKGEKGFDGIPGILGDVGFIGYNGEHGQMGPPGFIGHIGFIGMPGAPGHRGHIGEVGYVGPPGEPGRVGDPGPVGFYGEPGQMGETGFIGPAGGIGYIGKKGEIGMPGEIGPWGPVGRAGPVYDPYEGMITPVFDNIGGSPGIKNCTGMNDSTTNCSSYEETDMKLAPQYNSKFLPAFYKPPPGAQVISAEPSVGQFQVGKAQIAYGPPVYGKHYSPAYGHNIAFFDEEDKDILNEHDYLQLLKSETLKNNETKDDKGENVTQNNHPDVNDKDVASLGDSNVDANAASSSYTMFSYPEETTVKDEEESSEDTEQEPAVESELDSSEQYEQGLPEESPSEETVSETKKDDSEEEAQNHL